MGGLVPGKEVTLSESHVLLEGWFFTASCFPDHKGWAFFMAVFQTRAQ